jgi:uncharacterized iron-regulated membrane protein
MLMAAIIRYSQPARRALNLISLAVAVIAPSVGQAVMTAIRNNQVLVSRRLAQAKEVADIALST